MNMSEILIGQSQYLVIRPVDNYIYCHFIRFVLAVCL